ncbi:MAG: AraC family transcriptional regulator [Balneolaceae bacterium]|nr:AraC family transcriptional regulator [Balneolaceae bacterium]MBO6546974.1 AraC family transcriptional regulator [Balneolaceae bacterium]MBO6649334.1 AraC family transcriptional regulator [Balneolaceae bacterium]
MGYSFDTWTSLFLLASAQGVFLAVVLLASKNQAKIILGIISLLFSITLIEYVFFWTGYRYVFPHLNRISDPYFFLFGPLIYYYSRSQIESISIKSFRNWVHLLPFILLLMIVLPYYVLGSEEKIQLSITGFTRTGGLRYFFIAKPWLQALSMICYLVMSWRLISENKLMEKRALRFVLYLFAGFVIAYTSYYIMIFTAGYLREYDYAISIAMTVFIYTIGYLGYRNELEKEKKLASQKYQNSTLSSGEMKSISSDLLKKMNIEKLYLNRDLNLEKLAESVNTSKHNLSQVLNKEIGKKFSDFINEFRIEEAKNLILDKSEELSISGIAREAGFNNKTSFNTAFKKFTGVTPTRFKESTKKSVKSD